jgi:hypothetical protein
VPACYRRLGPLQGGQMQICPVKFGSVNSKVLSKCGDSEAAFIGCLQAVSGISWHTLHEANQHDRR